MAAWYLAVLLLDRDQPLFAPIAAVIALGATHGQRGQRVFELVGGVILGIAVADLIVHAIGTGPWQAGVMVVLAMTAAVAMGGRELLVSEAAVSAIIIATLDPGARVLAGPLLRGADRRRRRARWSRVLLFPPDPALQVGRALNAVFAELGRTLGDVARALDDGDAEAAERALADARRLDDHIAAARHELLEVQRGDPLRPAPPLGPRPARPLRAQPPAARLRGPRHARARAQRPAVPARRPPAPRRAGRRGRRAGRRGVGARRHLRRRRARARRCAARRSTPPAASADLAADGGDLRLAEIVVQVRSLAVDLVRAADLAAGALDEQPERPTDELLSA